MGLFNGQFANVVEWEEFRDDMIFWKWSNRELKKGSRLVLRPGQDAVFMYNGRIEGIFKESGNYEVESAIIPFLSTLKGFKFGFNSGLRAEVLFVNTKEFTVKWGTKSAINIPTEGMPGGIPVRAFGTFIMKVGEYVTLIDNIAGVKQQFSIEDVRDRVTAVLDQLIMRHIVKEGKNMFNLQSNASEIAKGVRIDLDMEMQKIGLDIIGFNISNVSYPEAVQKMIDKNASYGMVGNIDSFQRISAAESMGIPGSDMGSAMGSAMGMMAGMNMANKMFNEQNRPTQNEVQKGGLCPECGAALSSGAAFCSRCGAKVNSEKFCIKCGEKLSADALFCAKCGTKQ
ncbi:MAG: SPFH domain-containing protein [Clostridia bacterium]